MQIHDVIPSLQTLLAMQVEELAFAILKVAQRTTRRGDLFHAQQLDRNAWSNTMGPTEQNEYQLACAEAMSWLKAQGLLLPAPGTNGQNGFLVLSRRAKSTSSDDQFAILRQQATFPRELVHPAIAETCWVLLARGELSLAVFNAFRHLEVMVRGACGYDDTAYGQVMIRKAFNPETGPLSDSNQGASERQALHDLMCGAFGSYKNPHSHRIGEIKDHREAQEMVLLASHLMRIVESRKPAPAAADSFG